jgi:hypothetical protein
MPVRQILRAYDAAELQELRVFVEHVEPMGFQMDNLRFGTLATEIRRAGFGFRGRPPQPGDWFRLGDGCTSACKPVAQQKELCREGAARFQAWRDRQKAKAQNLKPKTKP